MSHQDSEVRFQQGQQGLARLYMKNEQQRASSRERMRLKRLRFVQNERIQYMRGLADRLSSSDGKEALATEASIEMPQIDPQIPRMKKPSQGKQRTTNLNPFYRDDEWRLLQSIVHEAEPEPDSSAWGEVLVEKLTKLPRDCSVYVSDDGRLLEVATCETPQVSEKNVNRQRAGAEGKLRNVPVRRVRPLVPKEKILFSDNQSMTRSATVMPPYSPRVAFKFKGRALKHYKAKKQPSMDTKKDRETKTKVLHLKRSIAPRCQRSRQKSPMRRKKITAREPRKLNTEHFKQLNLVSLTLWNGDAKQGGTPHNDNSNSNISARFKICKGNIDRKGRVDFSHMWPKIASAAARCAERRAS